jgi:alkylation response protein AidB-like acyl-CoA dehydrogenase
VDLRPSDDAAATSAAFRRLFAAESPVSKVRAAEPLGFDPSLWNHLLATGLPTMGVAEDLGGEGADMCTLAGVAEAAGGALAPSPIVESIVATRLATKFGVAVGDIRSCCTTIALCPSVDGQASLVPAGAVADQVVGMDDGSLVLAGADDGAELAVNLGSLPLADRWLREPGTRWRRELAKGAPAAEAFTLARSEWRLLTSAALVGLAAQALSIGLNYVKGRRQFGVPIGSFQAVSQRLADDATAVEGARLLTYEAAWSHDLQQPDASALSRMAFIFAAETAQRTTADVLHFHGGYGFTLEYDIQLYFRRAKAWPLVLADMTSELEGLASDLFVPAEGR